MDIAKLTHSHHSEEREKPVNLLWTGGWDSTYRILQLLLSEKKQVQTHYIIDEPRNSAGIEIFTINQLKSLLYQRYPYTEKLILPTIYINRKHIQQDEKITLAWNFLKSNFHIGTQYDWLARYCKQARINDMELSLFYSYDEERISEFRKNYCRYFDQRSKGELNLKSDPITENLNVILQYFQAPLQKYTKSEMEKSVIKNGWMPIMKFTRFCYNPYVTISPCGKCIPCSITINDGMIWRIPLRGRFSRKKLFFKIYLKKKMMKFTGKKFER